MLGIPVLFLQYHSEFRVFGLGNYSQLPRDACNVAAAKLRNTRGGPRVKQFNSIALLRDIGTDLLAFSCNTTLHCCWPFVLYRFKAIREFVSTIFLK